MILALLSVMFAFGPDEIVSRQTETSSLFDEVRVQPGTFKGRARNPAWSGSWWPYSKCELGYGWGRRASYVYSTIQDDFIRAQDVPSDDLSPLAKYDLWNQRRYKEDPLSAWFELRCHHVYGKDKENYDRWDRDYGWWGHCNGWAAASIMEREPLHPIVSEGIRFGPADLKGLLTESWVECETWQVGHRVRMKPGTVEDRDEDAEEMLEDIQDGDVPSFKEFELWYFGAYSDTYGEKSADVAAMTHHLQKFRRWFAEEYPRNVEDLLPEDFHRLLVTRIGRDGQGLILELDPMEQVWNTPAFGYEVEIRDDGEATIGGTRGRRFEVRAIVDFAVSADSADLVGTEQSRQSFEYVLYCDGEGRIVRGEWDGGADSRHPDFAWAPVRNYDAKDYAENSRLRYERIEEILPVHHQAADRRVIDLRILPDQEWISAESWRSKSSTPNRNPIACVSPIVQARIETRETVTAPVARVEYWIEGIESVSRLHRVRPESFRKLGESALSDQEFLSILMPGTRGDYLLIALAYSAEGRLLASDEIAIRVP